MDREPCRLCGSDASIKRRVQIFPWKTVCLFICEPCTPQMIEAVEGMRKELLSRK